MPIDPMIARGIILPGEGMTEAFNSGFRNRLMVQGLEQDREQNQRWYDTQQMQIQQRQQEIQQRQQAEAERRAGLQALTALKNNVPGAWERGLSEFAKTYPGIVSMPAEQQRSTLMQYLEGELGIKPEGDDVPGSYKEWRLAKDDPTGYGRFLEGKQPKGTSVNLSVNTEKGFYGELATQQAKTFSALADAAQSAPARIERANRVIALLDQVPYTGTGADYKLAFGKAAKAAGFDYAGDDVATTEALASELAGATLDAIKTSGLGSGQGFTDKDRQFLEKASAGTITLDNKTLRYLANLNKRAGIATIRRYNEQAARLKPDQLGVMGMPQNVDIGDALTPDERAELEQLRNQLGTKK